MTDDRKQVHAAVIDQAFNVQLRRIAPQGTPCWLPLPLRCQPHTSHTRHRKLVRKDEIIDPTMAQLRQELGPIIQDAIAGNQTQAPRGLEQSIQTLQESVDSLRNSFQGIQGTVDTLRRSLQETTRQIQETVERQGRNLNKRITDLDKKLEERADKLEETLVKRSDEIYSLLAQVSLASSLWKIMNLS